jgi:hypothetical protein
MIQKKPAPHLMRGVKRFSLATNAEGVCAEMMPHQEFLPRNQRWLVDSILKPVSVWTPFLFADWKLILSPA